MKYLSSSNIKNKTVFLRVDFNEPLKGGKLADDFRIVSALPSILKLQKQNCKIIIGSHLGRPNGKNTPSLSLRPAAKKLAELLKIKFIETDKRLPVYDAPHLIFHTGDIRKTSIRETIQSSASKDIIFLENLRFYEEEEAGGVTFAKNLSSLAEIYVNDAFAASHRKDASIFAVPKFLPGLAGIVLEKEIIQLEKILHRPKKPFVLMMAGIKITDKEKTIVNLSKHADKILLGGGLANMIFVSRGYEIGLSRIEKEALHLASRLDRTLKDKIVLPKDVVVAQKSLDKKTIRCCKPTEVRKNELILDLGPKSILEFAKILKTAKTIVWNGPLGLFEKKPFHHGTFALARVIGGVSKGRCFGVIGGGETVDAAREAGQVEHIDHLSTGGGAMLEFLAGNKLPGIEALK